MTGGAKISACGRYRFHLWRQVDSWFSGRMVWCMLNPSTADAEMDDNTIRKITKFTRAFGCGRLDVVNVYALRTPSPADVKAAIKRGENAVGIDNAKWQREILSQATVRVAAWGTHAFPMDVIKLANDWSWMCLGVNKDGSPKHPLYLSDNTPLTAWQPPRWSEA